ncbi:MAG: flagellar hook-length control protein FliK [Defluviitaleaceae bacterium]|nr:flagellar hook-length control protein FliK [Defluviitaleaceae bacterium]MCL2263543.1 flagellar hook-length control protein FliK [Defluviitaleaceae bacterium]
MNSFNVSIAQGAMQAPQGLQNDQRRSEVNWSTGQTITALFESVNDNLATLRTEDGVTFTADASSIQGRVGDNLRFLVQRTRTGFRLTQDVPSLQQKKQIGRGVSSALDALRGVANTLDQMKDTEELREDHRQEQAAKVAQAIKSIRRAQSFANGTGQKSAVAAMVQSGLDIGKVSFTDFNRVMHNIDKTPENPISEEELADGMNRDFKQPENAKTIVESLYKHGMSVSDQNVNAMEHAYEKLPEKVEPQAIEKLVANEQDLTLDNVYKSKHMSGGASAPPAGAPWDALQGALKRLFDREGIDYVQDNLVAARFLLDRDLPLTRVNIDKVIFLNAMSGNIPKDAFFDRAAFQLATDKPIGAMDLPEVARAGEAQIKFAEQAASRARSFGVDTGHMLDVMRTFNVSEPDAYRYHRMAGGDGAGHATSRMTKLFNYLANIPPLTVNVHAGIIKGQSEFTIQGIHESVLYARARSQYEQYATVPDARYGDSFAKVKGEFAPLLEKLDITPSAENLKASFILSKNSMDVTHENLDAVKEIDAKINALASKLHPIIAASMVQEGLNPLEMHVDQVLAYVKQFNIGKGKDVTGKIAQYIMEMDESAQIDPEVRKSMVALYRMLHIIQKDENAALGLAAEMGSSPTLGALMELAKRFTHIRTGDAVDMHVDESFGQLQRLIRPEGNIKGAVEQTADPNAKPLTHMDVVLDRFVDVASPAVLEALLNSPDGLEKPLEDLTANGVLPEASTYSSADTVNAAKIVFERMVAEQIQAFVAANPQLVHFLSSRNIATTVGNIKSLEKMTRSNRALAEELEEAEKDANEELGTDNISDSLQDTSLSGLRKGSTPGLLLARILDAVNNALPGKNMASIESLLAITHALNSDGESGFQLPIKVNGRISNLQLYVLNEKALQQDGARILLSLDTKNLGLVTAYFTMNADGVDIAVTGQNEAAVAALTNRADALTQMLFGAGIKIENVNILLDREPALETSLPPDALQQWATDSPEVRNLTSSTVDVRV